MDDVSAAASIFALLQATAEVVDYLKDVKDAPKECRRCQTEASNLHNLLNNLLFHVNQRQANESWFTKVRALTIKNGPLEQYQQALELLLLKAKIGDRVQKVKRVLQELH